MLPRTDLGQLTGELDLERYPLFDKEGLVVCLPRIPVFNAFSTMRAGNMSYNWGERNGVDRNIERFHKLLGLDQEKRVHIVPEHGTKIFEVNHHHYGLAISCDGLITTCRNLGLSLYPADCFPLILTSLPQAPIQFVGLFHVGLRGALQGMVQKAVSYIKENFGVSPNQILAGIGPGIHKCCYRGFKILVGALAKGWRQLPYINVFSMSFDLQKLIWQELQKEGVRNIYDINLCTFCSKFEDQEYIFFSHCRAKRFGEREGRGIALVAIK